MVFLDEFSAASHNAQPTQEGHKGRKSEFYVLFLEQYDIKERKGAYNTKQPKNPTTRTKKETHPGDDNP